MLFFITKQKALEIVKSYFERNHVVLNSQSILCHVVEQQSDQLMYCCGVCISYTVGLLKAVGDPFWYVW